MELESNSFYKVAQIVRTSYDVRVRRRRRAAHGNSPAMGVVARRQGVTFFLREHDRGVAVDDRPEYAEALAGEFVGRTHERASGRTYSHSDALVGHRRGRRRGGRDAEEEAEAWPFEASRAGVGGGRPILTRA